MAPICIHSQVCLYVLYIIPVFDILCINNMSTFIYSLSILLYVNKQTKPIANIFSFKSIKGIPGSFKEERKKSPFCIMHNY